MLGRRSTEEHAEPDPTKPPTKQTDNEMELEFVDSEIGEHC